MAGNKILDCSTSGGGFYRELDTPGLVGDPTDAINKTGWKPEYSLEEIIKDMINYDIEKSKS